MARLKSFIKTVGGKTQLLPELMRYVPESFNAYHEPFVGGGALYWHLSESGRLDVARLADAEERLVRTWRAVRSYPGIVIAKLQTMPNEREFFERVRADPPDHRHSSDVAAWRIYLAKTAYNGLYRLNRSGGFNAPFGGYEDPNIADEATIYACSAAMHRVKTTIRHARFEESIALARAGDLVYADPPYIPVSDTSDFTGYTADGFGLEDHEKLRDALLEAKQRGAHIIASNADVPYAWELYGDRDQFEIHQVSVSRRMAASSEKRGRVGELIIT